jgi:hypothetical protein
VKKTDVIIPINPLKDSLQVIVVNTKKGVEVIPVESNYPRLVIVQVEEGERVKVNIDKRNTVKLEPKSIKSVLTYYTYNINVESDKEVMDPNCDYFFSDSKPVKIKQKKDVTVANRQLLKESTVK